MSKAKKLENDYYIDSTGIVHNKELLSNIINQSKTMDLLYNGKLVKGQSTNLGANIYQKYRQLAIVTSQNDGGANNTSLLMTILKSNGYTRVSGVTLNDWSNTSQTFWNIQLSNDGRFSVNNMTGFIDNDLVYVAQVYGLY